MAVSLAGLRLRGRSQARAAHPVDEVLPAGQLFVYGAQHVLAMYAGAIAVPLLVGSALHLTPEQLIYLINADLFTSGIASFVQAFGFGPLGVRLPLIQGVTFAAVAPMILIGQQYGIPAIYGAVIVAGLATMLLSGAFSRLLRFFPPLVMGTIITTIGVSLMPVAVLVGRRRQPGGGDVRQPAGDRARGVHAGGGARSGLVRQGLRAQHGRAARHRGRDGGGGPPRDGGLLGGRAGRLGRRDDAVPLRAAELPARAVLVMVLVMLVTMTETTGDILAVGEMVDRPATPADLKRGLMADGFCTILGGVLNSFPYTAFAENVGLVGLSRVKSRFVVAAAGLILMVLGLFPKAAAIVASIPTPVIGGAGLVMFGMVAATGIRILQKTRFDGTNGALVLGVSVGLGLIPVTMPAFYQHMAPGLRIFLDSGIAVGAVAAILLNLALNWRHHAAEGEGELQAMVAAE